MNKTGRYRRYMALTLLSAALGGIVGCGEKKPRMPAALPAEARCTLCGMVLADFPGPKAELYLKGVDAAATFCSARDALSFALQPENRRRLEALYVLAADDPSRWLSAADGVFVVAGRFEGAMGSEPALLKDQAAAERFIAQWGGRAVRWPDLVLQDVL